MEYLTYRKDLWLIIFAIFLKFSSLVVHCSTQKKSMTRFAIVTDIAEAVINSPSVHATSAGTPGEKNIFIKKPACCVLQQLTADRSCVKRNKEVERKFHRSVCPSFLISLSLWCTGETDRQNLLESKGKCKFICNPIKAQGKHTHYSIYLWIAATLRQSGFLRGGNATIKTRLRNKYACTT